MRRRLATLASRHSHGPVGRVASRALATDHGSQGRAYNGAEIMAIVRAFESNNL